MGPSVLDGTFAAAGSFSQTLLKTEAFPCKNISVLEKAEEQHQRGCSSVRSPSPRLLAAHELCEHASGRLLILTFKS